tara:strand:+ start:101 stop:1405 length:1305 start_codon:yes stop_codon:yes gene_type:complete
MSETHKIYKNNYEWDELWKDGRIIAKQRVWKNKSVYQSLWSDGTTRQITRYDRKISTFQSTLPFESCSSEHYSKGGQLLEQNSFNKGNHSWIHKEFYDNGKLKLKWKVVDDFLHGKYECFFENGQIRASGKYRHGKSSGIHKKWDSKGNLLFCGRFFDGILFGKDSDGKPLEGFIETYYEDETPQFKGKFINGVLDGMVQIWTRNTDDIIPISGARARKTSVRYAYKGGKRHIWKMSPKEFHEWSESLWLDYHERWCGYPTHDKYHTQLLLKYFLSHGRSEGQPPAFPPATPNVWGNRKTSWLDQKWNIEFIYTYHKDCTEVLIYWQLPLLEQYVGKISKSDFRNPCSDTQSKVWRYFNRYMQAYQVLDTDILTQQLFWKFQKDDLKHIVKTKKRLNNNLFLTLFIPKVSKFEEMSYEDFHDQSLAEFFLYYDV